MTTPEQSTPDIGTAFAAASEFTSEEAPFAGHPQQDPAPDSPPGWLRALRRLAWGWWKLFAIVIVGNFLPGAVLAALQGGLGTLWTYLTTWGLLQPIESGHPLVFWLVTVVLATLAVVGFITELEERRGIATALVRLHESAEQA